MISPRWLPLLLILTSGCEWLDQGRMPCETDGDCFSGWSCGAVRSDGFGRCEEVPRGDDDDSTQPFSYDYATFDVELSVGEVGAGGAAVSLALLVSYMDSADATICTQGMLAAGTVSFGLFVTGAACTGCTGSFVIEQSSVQDQTDPQDGGCLAASLDAVGENLGRRLLSLDASEPGGDLLRFFWMPQAAWEGADDDDDFSLDRAGTLFPEDLAADLEGEGVVLAGVLLRDCSDGSPLLCQRGLASAATVVNGLGSTVSFAFLLASEGGPPTDLPLLRGDYTAVGWWAVPPAD